MNERRRKLPRGCVIALAVLGGLFFLDMLYLGFNPASSRMTKTTFSINNGKYVQLVLKMYADDHDGHMPNTLYELSPTYLPQVEKWGFCYDNTEPRHYSDWLYFRRPSLSHAPSKNILLASSWAIKEATFRPPKRVIILFDGTYELLSEDDFQTRIMRELR